MEAEGQCIQGGPMTVIAELVPFMSFELKEKPLFDILKIWEMTSHAPKVVVDNHLYVLDCSVDFIIASIVVAYERERGNIIREDLYTIDRRRDDDNVPL